MHFRESDLRRILTVAAVAATPEYDAPFGSPLLEALGELIPVDHQVVYYEFDHASHATPIVVEHPHIELAVDQETIDSLCAHYPLRELDVGEAAEPLILSDFLSTRALRRNPYYARVLRPYGVEHEMKLFLPSQHGTTCAFVFTRTGQPNFDERERSRGAGPDQPADRNPTGGLASDRADASATHLRKARGAHADGCVGGVVPSDLIIVNSAARFPKVENARLKVHPDGPVTPTARVLRKLTTTGSRTLPIPVKR
jgi:hypothetical protein